MKILPTSSILSSLMFLLTHSKVSMVVSHVCVCEQETPWGIQNKLWHFPLSVIVCFSMYVLLLHSKYEEGSNILVAIIPK